MNRDDIIRMAQEAGIPETEIEGVFRANSDDLGRLLAAEREACAQVAESYEPRCDTCPSGAANAIRARGSDAKS